MNKLSYIVLLSVLFVSGCETMTALNDARTKGLANSYSCSQINAAFDAYEADKNSFSALKEVSAMIGLKLEQTPAPQIEVSSYYDKVKAAANIALLTQGCPVR